MLRKKLDHTLLEWRNARRKIPAADSSCQDWYRYERKFNPALQDRSSVEMLVRLNPACFSEIYRPRWVNNIYCDTWQRDSYHDNLDGRYENRIKTRIRWYGDLTGFIRNPVLELKIRQGLLNTKRIFAIPDFTFPAGSLADLYRQLISSANLANGLDSELLRLEPALVNRYLRSYYLSADRTIRSTVDSELTFFAVDTYGKVTPDPVRVHEMIVELKYASEHDSKASSISQHFPFRLSRFSKYVIGIQHTASVRGARA